MTRLDLKSVPAFALGLALGFVTIGAVAGEKRPAGPLGPTHHRPRPS